MNLSEKIPAVFVYIPIALQKKSERLKSTISLLHVLFYFEHLKPLTQKR